MKYTEKNKPIQCMMTQSTCYKGTGKMTPKGVLWHCTGANNPSIKRYVQPYVGDPNYDYFMKLLGTNKNGNDWNHIYIKAGVNAWIGKLADGTVTTIQTLPWEYMPWGCGQGKRGSCNNGWIQFEICEDSLNDKDYFEKVYREACELTAYLCKVYGIDPQAKVLHCGIDVPTILCHYDSHNLGLGSNHGDVYGWFNRYGRTMQDVRDDVYKIMNGMEDEDMDVSRFKELWSEMRKELQDNDSGQWSAEARQWAIDNGLIAGNGETVNGQPNYMWCDLLTREQAVTLFFRFAQLMGKA